MSAWGLAWSPHVRLVPAARGALRLGMVTKYLPKARDGNQMSVLWTQTLLRPKPMGPSGPWLGGHHVSA